MAKLFGARLFISDRTVAAHVGNIMNKLGLNSRAQIAVWMSSD
jgi:DNA-binding CsgD family transcriptional regulator